MSKKKSGIYKIVNKSNGKVYVGQSSNLHDRWVKHRQFLKNNTHHNKHLQHAWNKYGQDAFKFKIIEYCDLEDLDGRESYWIQKMDSYNNGYNLDLGGRGIRGYKHTEEEIRKMRKSHGSPVVLQFDSDFNLLNRWIGGTGQAIKSLGGTHNSINIRCRHLIQGEMTTYKNCYWVYEKEYESDHFSWDNYLNNIPAIKMSLICNLKCSKNIVQYTKDRKLIKIWTDLNDLIDNGYDVDRIRLLCNRNKTLHQRLHRDCIWTYEGYDFLDGYFDIIYKKKISPRCRPVNQVDENGSVVNTYDSITKASIELSGKLGLVSSIIASIKSEYKRKSHGYYWEYAQ